MVRVPVAEKLRDFGTKPMDLTTFHVTSWARLFMDQTDMFSPPTGRVAECDEDARIVVALPRGFRCNVWQFYDARCDADHADLEIS
jgi:hypothetical protein